MSVVIKQEYFVHRLEVPSIHLESVRRLVTESLFPKQNWHCFHVEERGAETARVWVGIPTHRDLHLLNPVLEDLARQFQIIGAPQDQRYLMAFAFLPFVGLGQDVKYAAELVQEFFQKEGCRYHFELGHTGFTGGSVWVGVPYYSSNGMCSLLDAFVSLAETLQTEFIDTRRSTVCTAGSIDRC